MDEFKVRSWNSGTSAFDVIEHYDPFTIDGSGYGSDTLTYDLAGNLLFDGSQKYTYDGWQRMRTVAHAYRDGSGDAAQECVLGTRYVDELVRVSG